MAGYVLKHARVSATGITSATYNTATTLLTVTAGHLYIIKGLKQLTYITSTSNAIAAAGSKLTLSNNAGANDYLISASPNITSAGAITNAALMIEWAGNASSVSTDADGIISGLGTQAVTSGTLYSARFSGLRDMHLEAGQILKHVPGGVDLSASAWSISGTVSAYIVWEISYIDYTI